MSNLITANKMTSMEITEITPDSIPKTKSNDKQKGIVYVLDAGDSVKIGRTSNPSQRIPIVINTSGRTVKRIAMTPFCNNYIAIENALHKKLATNRSVGEWFDLDYSLILKELCHFQIDISNSKPKENKFLKLFEIAHRMGA